MKTINGFFETENSYQILTLNEMITVKGGENPPVGEDDPFKKKKQKNNNHQSNSRNQDE